MKNNSKNLISSLAAAIIFSFLFVIVANGRIGVAKFDIYLGMIWVFFLSFIVILSLAHLFNDNKQDKA